MAQELKVYRDPKEGPYWREFYEKSDVDAVLAEKDATIAELKQKLESVQASMDADLIDAGMEIRRLQRALYKACANWAHYVKDILFRDEHEAEKWSKMENRCRAKAEEYK